jgi:hypothetical protein
MPHRGVRDRLPESKLVVIVEHTRIATDGTTVETIESPYHLLEHRDGVREDERSLRSRWTNQSYANADSLNGGVRKWNAIAREYPTKYESWRAGCKCWLAIFLLVCTTYSSTGIETRRHRKLLLQFCPEFGLKPVTWLCFTTIEKYDE